MKPLTPYSSVEPPSNQGAAAASAASSALKPAGIKPSRLRVSRFDIFESLPDLLGFILGALFLIAAGFVLTRVYSCVSANPTVQDVVEKSSEAPLVVKQVVEEARETLPVSARSGSVVEDSAGFVSPRGGENSIVEAGKSFVEVFLGSVNRFVERNRGVYSTINESDTPVDLPRNLSSVNESRRSAKWLPYHERHPNRKPRSSARGNAAKNRRVTAKHTKAVDPLDEADKMDGLERF